MWFKIVDYGVSFLVGLLLVMAMLVVIVSLSLFVSFLAAVIGVSNLKLIAAIVVIAFLLTCFGQAARAVWVLFE